MFSAFFNKPSYFEAQAIIACGMAGEPPLAWGGELKLEYVFDEFKICMDSYRRSYIVNNDVPGDFVFGWHGQEEAWANIAVTIHVDKKNAPFIFGISRDGFEWLNKEKLELIHKNQTR